MLKITELLEALEDKTDRAYVVYQLTLESGKIYIGYTSDFARRYREHRKTKRIIDTDILYSSDCELYAREVEGYYIDLTYDNNTNKNRTGVSAKKLVARLQLIADYGEDETVNEHQAELTAREAELTEEIAKLQTELKTVNYELEYIFN